MSYLASISLIMYDTVCIGISIGGCWVKFVTKNEGFLINYIESLLLQFNPNFVRL